MYSRSRYRAPVVLPDPSTLPFPGNLVRECRDCDLRNGCTAPVPGIGPTPAEVMFVGQNPGFNEDREGKPFVGQSGRYLDSLLFSISLPRDLVYISNLVHCLSPNNRAPKASEIFMCSTWLDMELSVVQPRIIVAMGAPAIARFLGQSAGTVEHLHGKPVEITVNKRSVILLPCYHPAAALRDTSLIRHCASDFQVLRGLVKGHDVSEYNIVDAYPDPDYRVCDTPELFQQLKADAELTGEFAVDVETIENGSRLWSVQISTRPGTGWFVPIKPGDSRTRFDLSDWDATAIVHFYLNDVKYLKLPPRMQDTMTLAYLVGAAQGLKELASRLCGVRMITYREMVRPGQRSLSLAYLNTAASRTWSDPPPVFETKWDNKKGIVLTRLKKPWHISRKIAGILAAMVDNAEDDPYKRWNDITVVERAEVEVTLGPMPEASLADIKLSDAVQYSVRDADVTLRVKHELSRMISDLGLDFVLHMDLDILPLVDEMMANGMAVDVEHYRRLSADYAKRMRLKAAELAKMVGHPFNPNSSDQVATVVYKELGFKPTGFTPSKEISTDDSELKKTGHPIAKGIIQYRGLSKLKGTYADNMVRSSHPDAYGVPRMHTVIKTTRVATGRLSSSKDENGEGANLQNIPTRNKESKAIKNGFIAPPGYVLAEADYGQVEMCTQADLAVCKGLIELFMRGGDPHTETAARLFDVPLDEAAKDKYRYPCKRAGFGIIYLIGAEGLHSQIVEYIADLEMDGQPVEIEAWDVETCQKFIDDYYKLYPEIRDYQLERAAEARRKGYVRDLFGRIRYIPEVTCPIEAIRSAGFRMAANFPVTATATGIIKLAMSEIWRGLPNTEWYGHAFPQMQIHDSLLDQVAEDESILKPYLLWKKRIMTGVVRLKVPLKVDFKVGKRWGEIKKYELEESKP